MLEKLAENWVLKVISLIFAVVLWFFVMGERRLEVGYAIPLELQNIPEGMMVTSDVPRLVDVRISGPRTLLMNLRPTDIDISVDLKGLQPGVTSFKRLEERLNLPSGLKVTRLSPSFIDVKLERIREKTVPVKILRSGTPAEGFRIAGAEAVPDRVTVEGAESELKDVHEVVTEPVDTEGVKESFTLTTPLNYRGKYSTLKGAGAVEVQVDVQSLSRSNEEKGRKTQ